MGFLWGTPPPLSSNGYAQKEIEMEETGEELRDGKTSQEPEKWKETDKERCRNRGNNNREDFLPAMFMIKQIHTE